MTEIMLSESGFLEKTRKEELGVLSVAERVGPTGRVVGKEW